MICVIAMNAINAEKSLTPLAPLAPAPALTVVGLPAFDSNYLWLIHNGFYAWAVDPGDATVVQTYLDAQGLNLTGILITHHHADHVGGVQGLKAAYPKASVIGPMVERIAGLDINAADGAWFELTGLAGSIDAAGDDTGDVAHAAANAPVHVQVLAVPGHTSGHVAYYLPASAASGHTPQLFCGDTLFAAGCGRLFEGTPAQMLASLQRLMALPAPTLVYCAHEYTASNLAFAHAVEPNNPAIANRIAQVTQARASHLPTVPFVLGGELDSNVFLRCSQPEIALNASIHAGIELSEPLDVFTALRGWKNRF
jgi:hydroxyacylglutathione hydrolase